MPRHGNKLSALTLLLVTCLVVNTSVIANQAKPVKLYLYENYKPFSYGTTKSPKGLYVELVTYIFNQMNQPYQLEILPFSLQIIAKGLPLVHVFEEMRNILINETVNYIGVFISILISIAYFIFGVIIFYMAYSGARIRGTLINMGE